MMNRNRKRKFGAGRIGSMETSLEKLVFILMYVKCYPPFDLIGFYFDMWGSTACRNMHFLLNVLEKTLQRNISLPKRRISTPQEFEELFPGITDVFMDGSERRVQKPRILKRRNKLISQIRVVVEHAVGGMKRFKAATDIYRNRLENIDDRLSLVSAGLWNYHILYSA